MVHAPQSSVGAAEPIVHGREMTTTRAEAYPIGSYLVRAETYPVGSTAPSRTTVPREAPSRTIIRRLAAWWAGIVSLHRSEALIRPGEAAGNMLLALMLWATWGEQLDVTSSEGLLMLVLHNLARYGVAYGLAFIVFYRLKWLAGAKFNPEYDDPCRLRSELSHWTCSVAIGTAYDVAMRRALQTGWLPPLASGWLTAGDVALLAPIALGADLHFYLAHRLLHQPALYRRVHSVHHLSRNPNPWSGLSFHPAEALLYFSSLPLLVTLLASHRAHYALAKGLLDFSPIWGHVGVGGAMGGSHHHFLHHTVGFRRHVNFGGTWLFDGIFGTGFVLDDDEVAAQPKKGH